MNKQQYLRSVRVLSDPVLYFEYDKIQTAMMYVEVAQYRYKKTLQLASVLAVLSTLCITAVAWVVQQNSITMGGELFMMLGIIGASGLVMCDPVQDLLKWNEQICKAESELNQLLWETRPNAKYEN